MDKSLLPFSSIYPSYSVSMGQRLQIIYGAHTENHWLVNRIWWAVVWLDCPSVPILPFCVARLTHVLPGV